jgi:alpha-1,2-mannosyltransferase
MATNIGIRNPLTKDGIVVCSIILILISVSVIFIARDFMGNDYAIFYSAAQIALKGHPEEVYNVEAHHKVVESVLQTRKAALLAWFYPPNFLLLVLPFGLLPFKYSLTAWIILTLCLYLWVIYTIAPHKLSLLLALGFPGILANLIWSQNGFLTTFLLGIGLLSIETNPALSGFMLAFLCYKPQYAILPFMVVIIGRHWKTLFWSLFFIFTAFIASGMVFGFNLWEKYFHNIPISAKLMDADWIIVYKIHLSTYSFVRLLSGNTHWAQISQLLVSAFAVIIVCCAWHYVKNHHIRCVLVSCAVLLASPYALQYDMVIISIPLAFYGWTIYQDGWLSGECFTLASVFLLPLFNQLIVAFTAIQLAPLALALLMAMALRRAYFEYNASYH